MGKSGRVHPDRCDGEVCSANPRYERGERKTSSILADVMVVACGPTDRIQDNVMAVFTGSTLAANEESQRVPGLGPM